MQHGVQGHVFSLFEGSIRARDQCSLISFLLEACTTTYPLKICAFVGAAGHCGTLLVHEFLIIVAGDTGTLATACVACHM
jgi:hypothetical protein